MTKTKRKAVTQANVVTQPANVVTQANASESTSKRFLLICCFLLNAASLLASYAPLKEISKDTGLSILKIYRMPQR